MFVYLIYYEDIKKPNQNIVKIGITRAYYSRLSTLQTGCPFILKLIGVAVGTRKEETMFHKFLSEYKTRKRCEWFNLPTALYDVIKQYFTCPPPEESDDIIELILKGETLEKSKIAFPPSNDCVNDTYTSINKKILEAQEEIWNKIYFENYEIEEPIGSECESINDESKMCKEIDEPKTCKEQDIENDVEIENNAVLHLTRGRKKKYHTEQEKAEAIRKRAMENYNKNKEYINQYNRNRYQERKAKQQIVTS